MERATFGAGCFWGVEAEFRRMDGVLSTQVGFMGGTLEGPSYTEVRAGDTGHAEVVEIVFDSSRLDYPRLLARFFECHDPTTLNRQGADVGVQYRSVIFYHSKEQRAAAVEARSGVERSGRYRDPVVTEIARAGRFYRAGEYHQQYLAKRELA